MLLLFWHPRAGGTPPPHFGRIRFANERVAATSFTREALAGPGRFINETLVATGVVDEEIS